ncbi:unnamed protein product, partial [Cyprideis torosa]
MAKKSLIAREVKRQKMVAKYAELRAQLKKEGKWDELDKLPKNSSAVRLHNRCLLTGRPKGYMRKFGINRVTFRQMALDDYLTRLRNAQKAGHRTVVIPSSKMKKGITEILYDQGYILKYKFDDEEGIGGVIRIAIKYDPVTKEP